MSTTSLPFEIPAVLAPMMGAGHPLFRDRIAEEGGVGMLCTEFVRVSRAPTNPELLRRAIVKSAGLPLSVQVMGNDADKMAEAAAEVARAGAEVVDINLGCPMPRIVRKGVGAAMLRNPRLLREVVSAMRDAVPGWLSAKIRAGFDDSDQSMEIVDVLQQAGVDYLTVHARRRRDFYAGVADWSIIARIVDHARVPVIGNGDVWYASDALRMRAETGCAAVMIGRPALRNPWIFRQLADLEAGREPYDPDGPAVAGYIEEIARRYALTFGRPRALGRLKELVRWIGRAIADDGAFSRAALQAESLDELLRVGETRLAPLGADAIDLDAKGKLRLERSGGSIPTPI